MTPRATYRVQLSAGFDLAGAAGLAGYLAAVGVSHLYASPLLHPAAGTVTTSWIRLGSARSWEAQKDSIASAKR